MIYQNAHFLVSAAKASQVPPDTGSEVAFAGRSNAGKSSAINTITNQRSLARTSKTPGRTQLINFFALDDTHRLVDLPGYGYAKVAESVKQQWQAELSAYLHQRQCLSGLILLMDIRHPLKDYDLQMLEWAQQRNLPVHILLTKADKLKRGAAKAAELGVKTQLKRMELRASVQCFSSPTRAGLEQVHAQLNDWLEGPEQI